MRFQIGARVALGGRRYSVVCRVESRHGRRFVLVSEGAVVILAAERDLVCNLPGKAG
jgi:hypothetical protein